MANFKLQLKRNKVAYISKTEAIESLQTNLESAAAGEPLIASYKNGEDPVKILFGIADGASGYTIFDSEAVPAEVQKAIDAIVGGDPDDAYDTIKKIADALGVINGSGEGSISKAEQDAKDYADAQISAAVSALDVADSAVAKEFVTSVSETDGKISVKRGSITSSGGTIVLGDNADGGINFEVVNSALTQYVGSNAIKVTGEGSTKTIALSINANDKVLTQTTDGLLTNINLTWNTTDGLKLIGKLGTAIATIPAKDFIKDGMLENVELKQATTGSPIDEETSGTFLVFTFNTDGGPKVINVNVTSLIDIYTGASGVTINGKVVSVKVDPASEGFLTVGANGVKLSGVQAAINAAHGADVAAIDKIEASVGLSADGAHVATSGKYTSGATTVVGEIAALDTALSTVSGKADAVQSEVDKVETAVGLKADGTYSANTANTYTSGATSVADAVSKLDAQAKVNANAIASEVNRAKAAEADLQQKINAVSGSSISVVAGNGISVSGAGTAKTIAVKLGTKGNTSALLEVSSDGLNIKDGAVIDGGTF